MEVKLLTEVQKTRLISPTVTWWPHLWPPCPLQSPSCFSDLCRAFCSCWGPLPALKLGSLLSALRWNVTPQRGLLGLSLLSSGHFFHCTDFNLQWCTHVYIDLFAICPTLSGADLFTVFCAGSRQCLTYWLSIIFLFFFLINKWTHLLWMDI